jgi:hypothetical protein
MIVLSRTVYRDWWTLSAKVCQSCGSRRKSIPPSTGAVQVVNLDSYVCHLMQQLRVPFLT